MNLLQATQILQLQYIIYILYYKTFLEKYLHNI